MNILIINSGSSSIKYQLIHMPSEKVTCGGLIERIGTDKATIKYKTETEDIEEVLPIADHQIGLQKIAQLLLDSEIGVIADTKEIDIVGHRVVHGGKPFKKTTVIDDDVKDKIKSLFTLAPLHNPPNLQGIILAEEIFSTAKQVAVFDTAFHHTIPEKVKKYAIPTDFYDNHRIQLYGFHGTSHKYVSEKAIEFLKLKQSKIITIHLGNGCSITAVKDGVSIDHSMGFTPSNGLIMGSRSGDIDHALIFHMVTTMGYNLEDVNTLLTKKSGMLGLTGYSDLRDIEAEAANGNKACQLGLEMNAYRIKKYIGSYAVAMNGLDAIVFTAGIGENSDLLRTMVCSDMDFMGIEIDNIKNEARSKGINVISKDDAKVKVMVIPTNEELEIAKQAYNL